MALFSRYRDSGVVITPSLQDTHLVTSEPFVYKVEEKPKVEKPTKLQYEPTHIPTEYLQLCEEVGFKPTEIIESKLKRFYLEKDIPLYDHRKVMQYLNHLISLKVRS